MVVFTCDGCGDILKKGQVDSHAQRCRRCDSVSCMDCSISFYGDDYRSHTSCVSEAERYEKTVYKGNKTKNGKPKKQNPQEAWMDLIVSTANSAPDSIRQHMEQLGSLGNVPRKEKQFRNFTANSLKLRGNLANTIVDGMWKYLCEQREKRQQDRKQQEEKVIESKAAVDTVSDDVMNSNTNSKDMSKDVVAENELQEEQLNPKLVKKTMKKLLKKAPHRSMKMKALRRAVGKKLGAEKNASRKLKLLLKQQIGKDTDKIKVDGKLVTLR